MGWLFWLSFSTFSCMFRWCSSSVDCVHRFSRRITAVAWYSQCISAVVWVSFVICSLPSLSCLSFPALFNVYHWWFLPFLQMFYVFVELFNVVHCFFAQLSNFKSPFWVSFLHPSWSQESFKKRKDTLENDPFWTATQEVKLPSYKHETLKIGNSHPKYHA